MFSEYFSNFLIKMKEVQINFSKIYCEYRKFLFLF